MVRRFPEEDVGLESKRRWTVESSKFWYHTLKMETIFYFPAMFSYLSRKLCGQNPTSGKGLRRGKGRTKHLMSRAGK